MTYRETHSHTEPDDDTNYEAWLREHALDTKVIGGGSEGVENQEERIEHEVGDYSTPADTPTAWPASPCDTSSVLDQSSDFVLEQATYSFGFAKLLIVLVPLLFLVGYYSYDDVKAAVTRIYSGAAAIPSLATTTIGLTVTPDNLAVGLVGHFTFDGPDMDWASTTAEVLDRSDSNNRGNTINIGQSNATQGKVGQGMTFNGSTSYIDNGNPTELNLSDENKFTLSAWVYPTATPNGVGVISEMYSPTDTTVQYEIGFDMDLAGVGSKLAVGFYDGTWRTVKDSVNIPLNQWVFITGTWDGTTLRLYKNGTQINSGTPGGSIPATNYDQVVIGKRHDTGGMTNFFPGKIDDVRVYNRALSATEVAQLSGIWLGGTIEATPLGGPAFACGTDTVLDADSNVYNTLLIGSQCWMKQNLRVGTRISGATTQTNNSTIEKWCYNNSDANCTSNNPNQPDGGLYQWNEAMQYSTTPGAQGICPAGWHIPTHDELTTLERAVCTTGSCATDFPYDTTTTGYRGTTEGTKLKPSGSSGFEFNLAGSGDSGSFFGRASYGSLWSSSESGGFAWFRGVVSGDAQVFRGADDKAYGLSVRCLQD